MARLGRLNGLHTDDDVTYALHHRLETVTSHSRKPPVLYYLAKGNGDDLVDYLQKYSWLPYHLLTYQPWQQVKQYVDDVNRKDIYSYRERDYGLGPTWSNGFSFCRLCTEEDVDVSGFSYWRRLHQFPGVDMCSRHRVGLSTIVHKYRQFTLPHDHLRDAPSVDAELIASVTDHPVVVRYEAVADGLLRRDGPIAIETAEKVLRLRCRELGLTNGGVIWHMALRHRMLRLAPPLWLAMHFTGYYAGADIDERSYQWRIRDPGWAPSSTMEYALALAVLFYSAEEALKRFADPETS